MDSEPALSSPIPTGERANQASVSLADLETNLEATMNNNDDMDSPMPHLVESSEAMELAVMPTSCHSKE